MRPPRLSILPLRSFQFSPRFRVITSTSLRLPLSEALIRYPLHFTPFPFPFPSPLCLLFCSPLLLSLFFCLPHCQRVLKGSVSERGERLSFWLFYSDDRNLLASPPSVTVVELHVWVWVFLDVRKRGVDKSLPFRCDFFRETCRK